MNDDDQKVNSSQSSDVSLQTEESSSELDPTKIARLVSDESERATSSSTPRNDDSEADQPTSPEPASEAEAEPVAAEPTPTEDSIPDETPQDDTPPTPTPQPPTSNDDPNAKWYVVHTYSGHENKVAATLKQRIESEHLEKQILEVLVPMQDKIEIKGGKKAQVKEKIFPGYILVKMILDDNTWLAVRTTQGVTSFVGMGNKPTPISESEVQTIIRFTQIQQPTFKQVYTVDDTVKIVDGPFAEFIGKVESVDEERGKVRILVSIFGRETPVELDFLQVQKI